MTSGPNFQHGDRFNGAALMTSAEMECGNAATRDRRDMASMGPRSCERGNLDYSRAS